MTGKAYPAVVVATGIRTAEVPFRRVHNRYKVRAYLSVLVATLAMALLVVSSASGSTSYVDGISDQHLYNWEGSITNLFGSAWVGSPPSHIKMARYVVQWNVMSGGGYANELSSFRAWYERAGQLGLIREVALADYTGSNEPSSSEYKTQLEAMLNEFTGISYVEAWNEPNHHSSAVKFYVEPAAAAHYMNSAYSVCQARSCTAVAGDFLDEGNMIGYEEKYISGSNLNPKDPPNWGMHPYAAVDTEKTTTVEAFRNALPGKGSESISFTEVGAYYCKKGESVSSSENTSREVSQAKHAAYLVNTLIPHTTNLEHAFYYELALDGTKRVNCSSVEDTELYAPPAEGLPNQPRSAAGVIWGPGSPPSASTGGASSLAPLQATLNGSVNPQGLADTKYYFRYGTTTEYTSPPTTPGDAGQSLNWQNANAAVSGLQPGTTYHFRIVATNENGSKEGVDKEFTTPGPVEAVTTLVSEIYQTQAQLNGTVNPRGYDAKYYFQYGETPSYGSTTSEGDAGSGSGAVTESATITGLEPGTTYYCRLVATSGGITSYGSGQAFTTISPRVSFQANSGEMYTYVGSPYEVVNTTEGMMPGTSPSIAAMPSGGYEIAFQANSGELYTYSTSPYKVVNTTEGMKPGTSPSIVATPGGGFEIAFQANSGELYTYSPAPYKVSNTTEGMKPGTSPSVAVAPSGEVEIAFQANSGELYTYVASPYKVNNTTEGMMAGTSPSIAATPGGFEMAFQANSGELYTYVASPYKVNNTTEGMKPGTSPSVAVAPSGEVEIAFQANSGELYTYVASPYKVSNTTEGMKPGTSPSIAATPGGRYEIAFQANSGELYTYMASPYKVVNTTEGMKVGTSPSISIPK